MSPTTEARYSGPAQGIWYAWDANGASLAAQAALVATDRDNYESLLALEEVDVPIVPATPIYAATSVAVGSEEDRDE